MPNTAKLVQPSFDDLVAWARQHVLASIPSGTFNQALFDVCERVARWRFEQDRVVHAADTRL